MVTRNKQEKVDMKLLIRETIHELFLDEEFINLVMKKFYDKVEQKTKEFEVSVKANTGKIVELENKIDKLQQNEKMYNVCMYGIIEEGDENLELQVLQSIKNIANINYIPENILSLFRIGKMDNIHKPRPIIIKFANYVHKDTLLKNRKKFKGSNIFIAEDLIKNRRKLLSEAQKAFGCKNCWSAKGNIYSRVNGNVVKLEHKDDLGKYL